MANEGETPKQEPGWFTRVFGGTLLSLVGLLTVTVISMCYNSINETRQEVVKLAKEQAEMVKQAELQSKLQTVWQQLRDIAALKEKIAAIEASACQQREECKSTTKELQSLRERIAVLEGKLQALPAK